MKTKRKFLLYDRAILFALQDAGVKLRKSDVSWFYTSFSPEIYYVCENNTFTLHHKKEDLIREALKFKISKDDFSEAKADMQGEMVQKCRYGFANSQADFHLEIYSSRLSTLITLVANFKSEEASKKFDFIKTFGEHEFLDISDDFRYKTRYLARFGKPCEKLNYGFAKSVFEKFDDMKFQIPPYADSAQSAGVIFAKIYSQILKSHDEYMCAKDEEALHKFRIAMRKMRVMVKFFVPLFAPKITDEILTLLKNIVGKTNQMRDIEVFSKFLVQNSAPAHFGAQMDALGRSINERTKRALSDAEFDKFRAKFEDFLKNLGGIYLSPEYEKIAKKFISNRLNKALKALRGVISELNEKSEIAKFHDARIYLKKVRYELEFCARIYESARISEAYKQVKIAQESFGALQDVSIWQNFIAMYQKASDKNDESFKYLLALNNELIAKTKSLKSEILAHKDEFLKSIKKAIAKIKIYR
ncbi:MULTISPECIES: CYTH and CHAD domain-containing protein [unclassified Campylobacter]|uniref:CYTH and CHAD domain-containing protein n=1 Tax=unclassified Campylobacter TaxID=2593542 RepID=UPI0022E9AD30|nr:MULTISPECIES: CHAD domain-containing protein [unclassified Campylobacter]MDA3055259.1 CHAD domain-containing protein [Campylobacter sp. VBCF_07 NA4]MDA3061511.1 CHAD domain-containing protein [Campylobacter sp. VBCF_02 NA5]MDA3071028.1 CHAD domain-containing protein [Campylobacter sp. VBCF_08 NA3]WBR53962.1 CHAD domain-containing protein [Campylobacter sp. VBCF_01 NA2]